MTKPFKTVNIYEFTEKHNLKTKLSDLGLPDEHEINEVISLMKSYNKSEAEICVWFQTTNSWLGGEKPINYIEYAEGDYLVYVAEQYVLPTMHG